MLCLSITGFETDPDQVTDILELVPTGLARKGDIGKSGRTRDFNGWWHDIHAARLTDGGMHDKALDELLQLLKGQEDKFLALRETIKPRQVVIYGGLYHGRDEQCGVWLNVEQMRLLAALGIEWSLDLFSQDQ